jgi:hypothetical protein
MNRKAMVGVGFVGVVAAWFVKGTSTRASASEDKIESSFKKTCVCKKYLKNDAIKAEAIDRGIICCPLLRKSLAFLTMLEKTLHTMLKMPVRCGRDGGRGGI